MNILFIAPMPMIPSGGGLQRVTDILAQSFQRLEHKVYFLCYRDWEKTANHQLSAPQCYIPFSQGKEKEFVGYYLDFLERNNIDCVIFQWVDTLIEIWLKNTPKSIKTISTIHTQPFPGFYFSRCIFKKYPANTFKSLIWKCVGYLFPFIRKAYLKKTSIQHLNLLCSQSDRLCLLSEAFIPRIRTIAPSFKYNNLVAINNPFKRSSSIAAQNKENLIVIVCRVENETKNVFGFVDIWEKMEKRNPNWQAIVIGDGIDLKRIKQYVRKKRINNIDFVGHQEDVTSYYQRAKIQLITSFTEGFPMVMIEGMAAGCVPVVFDTFESVVDIVDDAFDGFIVKALDNNSMIDKVQNLIDNESLRKEMSKNASKKINKFSSDIIAQQWLNLINSIKKD